MREKPTENTNHKTVLTKNLRLKRVCMGRKIPQKTLLSRLEIIGPEKARI